MRFSETHAGPRIAAHGPPSGARAGRAAGRWRRVVGCVECFGGGSVRAAGVFAQLEGGGSRNLRLRSRQVRPWERNLAVIAPQGLMPTGQERITAPDESVVAFAQGWWARL